MSVPQHPEESSFVHVCTECDLVSLVPSLDRGERARCPRCKHTLAVHMRKKFSRPLAYAITAVILAIISSYFPFISFSTSGISETMTIPQGLVTPVEVGYPFLSYCYLLGVLVLPMLYLGISIYLNLGVALKRPVAGGLYLTKSLKHMHPWVMADIFIVGVLVALVKIMSLAEIGFGLAFVTFCAYALMLLATMQHLDFDALFDYFCGPEESPLPKLGLPGIQQGFTGCRACGQPSHIDERGNGTCVRCGERLHARVPYSVQKTLALLLAACIFYIPAMALPVMHITSMGQSSPQTIIGGVVLLISSGDYPVAAVIFFASVMVPVAKVISLIWLCRKVKQPYPAHLRQRMILYRVVEFIGRWSMIDVFVVTVLTTMVQLSSIMRILPGNGIVCFALVVIITMIAAQSFDPRLLWDAVHQKAEDEPDMSTISGPLESTSNLSSEQDISR